MKGNVAGSNSEPPSAKSFFELDQRLTRYRRHVNFGALDQLTGALPMGLDRGEVERALLQDLDRSEAYRWLRSNSHWEAMKASLTRKAKSDPIGYGSKTALFELMECTAIAYGTYIRLIRSRTAPASITKTDLKKARSALQFLRTIEKRGANFSSLKLGGAQPYMLPFGWIEQLDAKIAGAIEAFRKPSTDERNTDRYALRLFCLGLWLRFGEVSPTLAQSFGALIDYDADSIRRHVKRWEISFRTDSLL